jgi:NDP-sugar pyrophosphorylase family protein
VAIRQALVPAAARLSTPDSYTNPKQLIRVDGTPIIIHLLKDLHWSGIERVVITLGYAARELREEVTKEAYGGMVVEFVVLQECSWKRGHASNILAARSMFPAGEPFLIIMSDHLYDRRLIAMLTVRRHVPSPAPLLPSRPRRFAPFALRLPVTHPRRSAYFFFVFPFQH